MNLKRLSCEFNYPTLLRSAGVSSYLAMICYTYLSSVKAVAGNKAFYRLKDLQEFTGASESSISRAVAELKECGVLRVKVVGVGSGRKSLFSLPLKSEFKDPQKGSLEEQGFQNRTSKTPILGGEDSDFGGLKTPILGDSKKVIIEGYNEDYSNTDVSGSSEPRNGDRSIQEVDFIEVPNDSKEKEPTSANDVVTPKPKKTKRKRRKPDHPRTDELHDKLVRLLNKWPLPSKVKPNRNAVRLLLTADGANADEVNRCIDYLNWRGYDKELKQDLGNRPPNEIRSVPKFRKSFDRLYAEMEYARDLHHAKGNRQQDVAQYVADLQYLASEQGQADVKAFGEMVDGI